MYLITKCQCVFIIFTVQFYVLGTIFNALRNNAFRFTKANFKYNFYNGSLICRRDFLSVTRFSGNSGTSADCFRPWPITKLLRAVIWISLMPICTSCNKMAGGVRAFWRGLPHKRAANWILMCWPTRNSADLARFMWRLQLQFQGHSPTRYL